MPDIHAAIRRCRWFAGLRGFAAAVLLIAIQLAGPQTAYAAEIDMPIQRVSPNSYFVQGKAALGSPENQNFISNAGLVVTRSSVVVIDALGSPAVAARLLREIKRLTDKPVSHVIVTHYHADHVYGLQVFKDAGARVIAQKSAWEYLGSETARLRLEVSRKELAPFIDDKTRLVEPDEPLAGDDVLVVGGTEFVLQAVGPAHTPEDLVVYIPSERVVFAGDIVFQGRIPYVGQADSRQWIVSLEKLLKLDAEILVPGHGPVSRKPDEDIRLTREYLQHLRRTMGDAARNLEPFEEAYDKTDWSRFKDLPLFGPANRMNAYNTYLLMEHEKD